MAFSAKDRITATDQKNTCNQNTEHPTFLASVVLLDDCFEWSEGAVKGLVARGGFEVDMDWEGGQLLQAKIHSRIGGVLRLRSYVPLKGKGLKVAEGTCPNPLNAPATLLTKPLVSKELKSPEQPILYQK